MTTHARAGEHVTEEYLNHLEDSGLITAERPSFLVLHVAATCPVCALAVERWRSRSREALSMAPTAASIEGTLAAIARQVFDESRDVTPVHQQWAELLALPAAERESWIRSERNRPIPRLLRVALSFLRQQLAVDGTEVHELAELVVSLAEQVPTEGLQPPTLAADLLTEALLLQAQAWLTCGWFREAARLMLSTQQVPMPEGSGDPHLDIELEATAALLAFAYRDTAASLGRWREARRLAYEIKDPLLVGHVATAEAWVRLTSRESAGSQSALNQGSPLLRPHWIGVLERIEMARREKADRETVN